MKNSSLKDNAGVLVLLLGLLACVASYFLGFTSYNDKNSELSANIESLEQKRDALKADYAKKDEYEQKTKEFDKKYEETLAEFDTTLTNESQVMDIYNMELKNNVLVTVARLNEPAETYAFDGSLTTSEMLAQLQTVDANGNVVQANLITTTSIDPSYRGVSCDEEFNMQGAYGDIKTSLKDIAYGDKRRVLKSVNITYDGTTEKIKCEVKAAEYAITGDDRKQNNVDIPSSAVGRENLFFDGIGVQTTVTQ